MKLLMSEIFQKVSNAKTKAEKIQILQNNNSECLRALLIWNFDESVISLLPPGEVPYKPNEAPLGTEHTRLEVEYKKLFYYVKNGRTTVPQPRRESMFIQLLEGLYKDEAEVLSLIKDKNLGKRYKITKACVQEAFPQIQWGGRDE